MTACYTAVSTFHVIHCNIDSRSFSALALAFTEIFLFCLFDPVPSERTVINKERMAGSYRLSAYYLAKLASELPLVLILPSIFMIITYWMTGLNGMNNPWAFFATVLVILFQAVASQSIGIIHCIIKTYK